MSDDLIPAKRNAWFTEYQSLRQESLQSVGNRNQIIAFGLAAIGALAGGSFAASPRTPELARAVFDIAIPLVGVLVYCIWFAELERMVKAGGFIQRLEQRINATFGEESVLSWEKYLGLNRLRYPYLVVAALFLGMAALAPFMGAVVQPPGLLSARDFWVAWPAVAAALLHTGYRALRIFPRYES